MSLASPLLHNVSGFNVDIVHSIFRQVALLLGGECLAMSIRAYLAEAAPLGCKYCLAHLNAQDNHVLLPKYPSYIESNSMKWSLLRTTPAIQHGDT